MIIQSGASWGILGCCPRLLDCQTAPRKCSGTDPASLYLTEALRKNELKSAALLAQRAPASGKSRKKVFCHRFFVRGALRRRASSVRQSCTSTACAPLNPLMPALAAALATLQHQNAQA